MTTGGFLTPKLYVSSNVWDQKGAKFSAVQTKMTCLQSVMEGLCKLVNVDINNTDDCYKLLDEFCGMANGVQNMLAKHLSFIKETKDEKKGIFKSVGTGMARLKTGLSSTSDDGYVIVLRETLAKTTVFDKWMVRYENGVNSRQVWELLSRAFDFFLFGGDIFRNPGLQHAVGQIHEEMQRELLRGMKGVVPGRSGGGGVGLYVRNTAICTLIKAST